MRLNAPTFYRFGEFELDVRHCILRKCGVKVPLQEQPFQVLMVLLEAGGETVTREDLRHRLWPQGTFVEFDCALNTAVKKIRKALSDDASVPHYVETIPRKGYRFIAAVEPCSNKSLTQVGPSVTLGWPLSSLKVNHSLVLVIASLLLPVIAFQLWQTVASAYRHPIAVVVLPFNFMNGDSQVAAQLALELTRDLERTHLHTATVILQKGPFQPRERRTIDYAIQGQMLREGSRILISVELVRIVDQSDVWSHNFEITPQQLDAKGDLIREIAQHLAVVLNRLGSEAG